MQVGMRAYNALDFDHLLSLTVELFEKHPFILKRYQERYRHLLIDEYQDTNPVQYRLTELLTGTENSLTVVGDDDQSIYGFRGADVSLIQNFQNAEVIKLEQNYRSTNTILRSANAVIKNNTARHEKSLWSNKGDGLPINVFVAPSDELEADAIAHRVATLKNEKNLRWSDIAILYRSNSISSLIEIALLKYQWLDEGRYRQGIPFQVFGGTEFFDKKEVKDIAAYLKVWLNPKDQEALLRIINFPRRGIGETSLDLLTSLSRTHNRPLIDLLEEADSLPLPAKAKEGIRAFLKTRERSLFNFQKEAPAQALELLIQEINYERAIHEEVKSDKMRDLKWDNVQKLVDALERYPSQQTDPLSRLRDFVSSISLNEHTFDKQSQMGNTVSLMTFHSAKGLEFPACFLVAMEDHLLPHERSTTKEALEEERRLMYVALTRAKSILTISMARQRKRLGKEMPSRPSRFLFEIPKELLQTTRWDI
ncbi:MAG: pcrA [Chlamydiales bacterium]|jgi:superfamily I DNA/RNA helicase|nr:pcrA [Chlamydiales bacterium]